MRRLYAKCRLFVGVNCLVVPDEEACMSCRLFVYPIQCIHGTLGRPHEASTVGTVVLHTESLFCARYLFVNRVQGACVSCHQLPFHSTHGALTVG